MSRISLVKELSRMFVMTGKNGIFISDNLGTNATKTTLSKLMQLKRNGWIEYEENERGSQVFGIKMWDCKLTQAGREVLEGSYDG